MANTSSSSSSSSSLSSSSSSSLYCQTPECNGTACPYFSNWFLDSVDLTFTTNNQIFARFNTIGSIQQVELYKDPTYFLMVASGQGTGFGTIVLYERNSSGITGSVFWGGSLVDFSKTATLYCYEFSSSSSSSSKDSSSTSSHSSNSSSSTSSGCCMNPYCDGTSSSHFSSWTFNGMRDTNSSNCKLYVGLDVYGSEEQIRVYKDAAFSQLVALGQLSGAGTITLSQVSGSGLSGSVFYDGTIIPYPSILFLDCNEFSSSSSSSSSSIDSSSSSSVDSSSSSTGSSSSSSSSSIDSSSSSSSSSLEYSSSSSTSLSSNSSSSYSSSSSSSSIDSSSSSSIDSSSSSSSIEIWNRGKPFTLANSAISVGLVQNRMAQTITLLSSTYTIGNVYCYLFGPYGVDRSYTIYMGVFECTDDGKPSTLLATKSMLASDMDSSGWQAFNFGIYGTTPVNGYLSFVVWQDGGDENNYVLWGHNTINAVSALDSSSSSSSGNSYSSPKEVTIAWVSNDATIWVKQSDVTRALRVSSNFNAFDLTNFKIDSEAGQLQKYQNDLGSASPIYVRTKLENNKVILDHPNLLISFVIDCSGSMGWNDRYNNRISFYQKLVNRIKSYYPSTVLFDAVGFGAKIADGKPISAGLGSVMTVNLSTNEPTRSQYVFTTSSSASAYTGSIYDHNGYTYTVSNKCDKETTLTCLGTGGPLASGTLVLQSGVGDSEIIFSSVTSVSINDQIVAYGLKNMENGHTYNIGSVSVDGSVISAVNINNWQMFSPLGEAPSISLNSSGGPKDTESIDAVATTNLILRKPFYNSTMVSSPITLAVNRLSTTIQVGDGSLFSVGDTVDLVSGDKASPLHSIMAINGNELTISPESPFDIPSYNVAGSIVESSLSNNSISITGTTLQLNVKDVSTTRNIIFYLQNINGLVMEWDLAPYEEWITNNLFWLDETALLPISIFDNKGNPFPDGTKVYLEVNERSLLTTESISISVMPSIIAPIGSTTIYVESISGYAKDMIVDLIDGIGHLQTVTISEVGQDTLDRYYIKIFTPLQFDFDPANGAKIVINDSILESPTEDSLIPISLPVVDVTPILTGTTLDPSKLQDYDITPVPPATPYSDLNYNRTYIQKGDLETPTIDGYGAIRILPITEDVPRTIGEKNLLTANLLRAQPTQALSNQIEENTGDVQSTLVPQNTSPTTTTSAIGVDYAIESPLYLRNGFATSAMTTTATTLTPTSFPGFNIPGVDTNGADIELYAKNYSIYPSIISETDTGTVQARQYFDKFDVYFVNPVSIVSKITQQVPFWCESWVEDVSSGDIGKQFKGYVKTYANGIFAGEGPFEIEYTVSNKGVLVQNGTLNINIYSNKVVDMENMACNSDATTKSFLNVKYDPVNTFVNDQIVTTQPYSSIDEWRNSVAANPYGAILTSSEGQDGFAQQLSGTSSDQTSNNTAPTETDNFYTNPNEWTSASQYTVYSMAVNIVNGKATLSIPSNDTVSTLYVEAYVSFNNFESICGDFIFIASPVTIGQLTPSNFTPTGLSSDLYEIGGEVTWEDGISGTIDDGVSVSFLTTTTAANPSVSVTDDGWAGGVFLGPHDRIVLKDGSESNGEIEEITIQISHPSGYTNTVKRNIIWQGTEDTLKSNRFYFKCTSGGSAWADGSGSSNTTIDSNLNDGVNDLVIWGTSEKTNLWVGENGISRLMGYGQPGNNPTLVTGDVTVPSRMTWTDGMVSFTVPPPNKNIGHAQANISPWYKEVNLNASYKWDDGTGMYGVGASVEPYYDEDSKLIVPKPKASFIEPLDITVDIEDLTGSFVRDGVQSPNVVATVTWKGQPLTNTFIVNEGTPFEKSVPNVFPVVTFKSGKCTQTNSQTVGSSTIAIDYRNLSSGCLVVADNPDAKLTSYAIQVSLSRTDIKLDHTHACTVDNSGNGTTTQTIFLNGVITVDHVHTITNYVALLSDGHTHNLRSVAVTNLLPTTNTYDNFVVNAYTVYDPTNCEPYDGGGIEYTPLPTDGNRLMFATLNLDGGEATQPKLEIELFTGGDLSSSPALPSNVGSKTYVATYYASETPGETVKGFDFAAHAFFSAYTIEDYPGHFVTIPARDVADGSRISFNVDIYKPQKSAELEGNGEVTTNSLVIAPDVIRDYLTIKVTASIVAEGQYATSNMIAKVNSNLQWIPNYSGLLPEATSDTIYLNNVVSQISSIGASPIYDAITMASQRLIAYQTDDTSLKNYKKIIILLTDGDENQSQYSIQQSIDMVSFVNGSKLTQVVPVKLGLTYKDDEIVVKKIANDTGGFTMYSVDMTTSEIDSSINSMLVNQNLDFNSGTYSNSIAFDDAYIIDDTTLSNAVIPSGTGVFYRARFSQNGSQWELWTPWTRSTSNLQAPEDRAQYIQYGIKLYGNEYFQTPEITEDVAVDYYLKGQNSVFFEPLNAGNNENNNGTGGSTDNGGMGDDEYLASIHITHEADIPSTSQVLYGVTTSNSSDPLDYFEVTPDNHTILLTRFNEIMITENNRVFTAINGRWPEELEVEIYRINSANPNGVLVNSSDYVLNSRIGTATFFNSQDPTDTFVICVYFNPVFRLICKIVNYGSVAAQIHHVGIIYNIAKRVSTDLEGSIIHTPVSTRV